MVRMPQVVCKPCGHRLLRYTRSRVVNPVVSRVWLSQHVERLNRYPVVCRMWHSQHIEPLTRRDASEIIDNSLISPRLHDISLFAFALHIVPTLGLRWEKTQSHRYCQTLPKRPRSGASSLGRSRTICSLKASRRVRSIRRVRQCSTAKCKSRRLRLSEQATRWRDERRSLYISRVRKRTAQEAGLADAATARQPRRRKRRALSIASRQPVARRAFSRSRLTDHGAHPLSIHARGYDARV
jgi:hypothetical protein